MAADPEFEALENQLRRLAGLVEEPSPARPTSPAPANGFGNRPPAPVTPLPTPFHWSEPTFRRLVEALPDALVLVTPDGHIVLVNARIEEMFGYRRDDLIGRPIEVLVPERLRRDHVRHRTAFAASPHVRPMGQGLDLHGQRRDGTEFPVEISLSPIEADSGLLIAATIRDVTGRKAAEAQLHKAEARYRILVEQIPAVTFLASLDETRHELYVSPQIEKLLGFTQREWLDNPVLWYDRLHPDDRERWQNEFSNTCSQGDHFRSDYRFLARDGRVVWVHGQAQIVRDAGGQPLFLHGVAFDITDAKLAEEAIRRANEELEQHVAERTRDLGKAKEAADKANRAKSEFLSRMSHELRTPLNAVLGFAQLLDLGDPTPRQRAHLEQILKGGRHLLDLINEVLDIARIEADRLELSLRPVSVLRLFTEVKDLIQPLAEQRGVHVQIHWASAEEHHVVADEQRLKQVLLNLVSNGVKYNRDPGSVTLSCLVSAPQRLRLTVSDTGTGIPPDKLERLFTPFDRLGAEATGVEGSGLGLVLSQRLTEAMGGSLSVSSMIGRGTICSLELPRATAGGEPGSGSAPRAAVTPESASRPTRTVLYVEDNAANLMLVEHIVALRPHVKLLAALKGGLGIELAREHQPDLILLDMHLPDMTGEEVLHRLQEEPRTRAIPLIAVSADANPDRVARLKDAGVYDYLLKPVDVPRFLDVLDRHLG